MFYNWLPEKDVCQLKIPKQIFFYYIVIILRRSSAQERLKSTWLFFCCSKTQISNRELLDGNRTMSDELSNARQKLKELSNNLKLTSKEKHDIEKSLISTNEELQQAYETLHQEKKDIVKVGRMYRSMWSNANKTSHFEAEFM